MIDESEFKELPRKIISSGIPTHETHFYKKAPLVEVAKRVALAYEKLTITKAVESIVVTGLSGSVIATALFINHDVPVIHIRRQEEMAHGYKIQGIKKPNVNYVIVDDLIASGNTMKHVLWNMQNKFPESICKAIILYRDKAPVDSFSYEGKNIPLIKVSYPDELE